MKLVYKTDGRDVQVGDKHDINGPCAVSYFRRPHKPSSEGKVTVAYEDNSTREFYVGVIGAKWVDRVESEDFKPYKVERVNGTPALSRAKRIFGMDDTVKHNEDQTIVSAMRFLEARLRKPQAIFGSPEAVKNYLTLKLAGLEHEVFGALFLDAQHGLLEDHTLFRGTLMQTSVYPREMIKTALKENAAAVILYHNHPSCTVEPSRADEEVTAQLKAALALVDVRVLDHIIVGGVKTLSFVERGLL